MHAMITSNTCSYLAKPKRLYVQYVMAGRVKSQNKTPRWKNASPACICMESRRVR